MQTCSLSHRRLMADAGTLFQTPKTKIVAKRKLPKLRAPKSQSMPVIGASETQPRETALWNEDDLGYYTICQSCGKAFSGLAFVSVYSGPDSVTSAPNRR